MSGFRSRFPTVTPWTTDPDLPDIVFRPCFTTVVSELVPACPSGAAKALSGRCPDGAGRAAASPPRGGAARAPGGRRASATRAAAGHRHRGRPGRLRSGAHGEPTAPEDRAPVAAARRGYLLAFRRACHARSLSRPGAGPYRPSSVPIIPPVAAGPRARSSSGDRHARAAGPGLVTGGPGGGLYPFRHVPVTVEPGG
jgi:hypothetical protein